MLNVALDHVNDQTNLALLLLRLCLGLFLAFHGYNKVFGSGGLKGTAGWFGSMGMKWPTWQARLAATTEIGAGVMLAVGLLTPFATAGVIGVMVVAIYTSHLKVGFFVYLPNQGWEYCATIAIGALSVGIMGPGEWSIDHAVDFHLEHWGGLFLAVGLGVGGAIVHLLTSYRPKKS